MFLLWGKHLNKYYLRYLPFFIVGVLSLLTVDWFQLKIPEILGSLVTEIKTNGAIDLGSTFFRNTMVTAIFVAVIMFIGRILWRLTLFFASKKIEMHLRNEMFAKAEELDITYYHNNKVGNVMSWVTDDIETVEEFLGWGSLQMVDGIFLTLFALIKMFNVSVYLAVVSLVPILLIAVVGMLCEGAMGKNWKLRQESNDRLYDYTRESFTGIRVIKAFVKEVQQIREFSKIARKNQNINIKFTRISVIFEASIEIIIGLVAAIIIGFGGVFVYYTVNGQPLELFGQPILLEAGPLVTFLGYFFSLIWPMIAIGQVVTNYSKARTSYRRIAHFLDTPTDIVDKEGAFEFDVKGNVEFKKFSFTYPGESKEALSNINLKINKGELVGVVGAVGSGKSTLVNCLLHLYNVNENQLFIDDVDIQNIKIDCLRRNINIAPQDNFLFQGTVKDNIGLSNTDATDEEIVQVAKYADVDKDIVDFEKKYDTLIAEGGVTISGGQKQRIALARAYLTDSSILILDDVVSAVDLKTEENILENIRKVRDGKTTIIVASRVSTLLNADRIIVLNKGKVEAFDTPKNLLNISETFKRMYLLQQLENKKGGTYGGKH